MAVKTQEKKTSQRETQLERKVTALEEELHKTKTQLDREYLAQEAKRAKVHDKILLFYVRARNVIHFSFNRPQKNFRCGRNRKNGSRRQKN